jgi:hypothetical protein
VGKSAASPVATTDKRCPHPLKIEVHLQCDYENELHLCQRCQRKGIPGSECVKVFGRARESREAEARAAKELQDIIREVERELFGEELVPSDELDSGGLFVRIQPRPQGYV